MAPSAELGAKGRLVIPAQVRQEAGVHVGQTLIVTADGAGRIVLETPEAVQARVWSAAPQPDRPRDAVSDIRTVRTDDSRRADALLSRRSATTIPAGDETSDEVGAALLRALDL